MLARDVIVAAAAVLLACAPPEREPPADESAALPAVAAAELPRSLDLPDSLLFRMPTGDEVWWTIARESAEGAGGSCVERGLEIRRDETRVAVPLLYSADVPEVVDDTTIQVRLWTSCRPGRMYRVNVRTGQPTAVPSPEAGS